MIFHSLNTQKFIFSLGAVWKVEKSLQNLTLNPQLQEDGNEIWQHLNPIMPPTELQNGKLLAFVPQNFTPKKRALVMVGISLTPGMYKSDMNNYLGQIIKIVS